MDIYTLDSDFYRSQVIDSYESFIWTERYSSWGDFQLVLPKDVAVRHGLRTGWYIGIDRSRRVMKIETMETTTSGGETKVTVTGRSLESVLEHRSIIWYFDDGTTFPIIEANAPKDIVENIFHYMYISDDGDVVGGSQGFDRRNLVPGFKLHSSMPMGTLPFPTDEALIYGEFDTAYDHIKKICDEWGLGFRLVRTSSAPKEMFFDCYVGSDRTMHQTALPPVIFSRGLDTLTDTADLITDANYKNVAQVYARRNVSEVISAQHQFVEVYGNGASSKTSGLNRRILLVDATDLDPKMDQTQLLAKMRQRGRLALREHRIARAFDGEVPQDSKYIYGRDYHLGDYVSLYDDFGEERSAIVSEQIFVSDQEGDREYPTLGD